MPLPAAKAMQHAPASAAPAAAAKHISTINRLTGLSTDYLNHFNEIVMLIEMVPDMPDMIEDCRLWHPKSYQQHFRDSGFSEKDLAIEAYDHVPNKFRTPFEATIAKSLLVQTMATGEFSIAHQSVRGPLRTGRLGSPHQRFTSGTSE